MPEHQEVSMKILLRLLSFIISVSIILSAFSLVLPVRSTQVVGAGESRIASPGELSVPAVSPEVSPSANLTEEAVTAANGGSISGHVYQADGVTPVADIEVYAEGYDEYDYENTVTADDGSYVFEGLDSDRYLVSVEVEGYLIAYYNGVFDEDEATLVKVVAPQNTPDIDFKLSPGGSISGNVYQSDGVTPVAGAEIHAEGVERYDYYYASTSNDGSYTLRTMYPDKYLVYVYAEGYLIAYYNGVFNEDEATLVKVVAPQNTPNIDFNLSTGGSISGHVYQSDGVTPVAGAEVYVDGVENYGYGDTITSNDGSYTIRTLCSDSYLVYVYAEGYLTTCYNGVFNENEATPVTVISPQETPNINFNLSTGGSISGNVYQADGVTPIEGAEIYASLQGTEYSYSEWAYTGSDGKYLITMLYPGNYQVRVTADDYFPEYYDNVYNHEEATLVPVTLSHTTSNIDFSVGTGGSISGHVYQMDGTTPIAGVEVYAENGYYGGSAYTTGDGSYIIRLLGTGNYHVYVEAKGYLTTYYNGVFDEDQTTLVEVTFPQETPNINFALSTGGSISGHVYQADGITPVKNARISASLQGKEYSYSQSASSDSNGSYLISRLHPGNYKVRVTASNYFPEYYDNAFASGKAALIPVALSGTTANIDFALGTGGSISGHVFQADGTTPIADAEVYADGDEYNGRATTADDGSYTIRLLGTDSYQVYVEAEGYLTTYYNGVFAENQAIDVYVTIPQDNANVDFILSTGGSISGHVYQADGVTPVADARINAALSGKDYSYTDTAYSKSDGSYLISLLVPGDYVVKARISSDPYQYYINTYNSAQATPVAVMDAVITPNIDFVLRIGGSISGHVYQADGTTPLAGARVYADGSYTDKSAVTADDGSYTIRTLYTDSYRVYVQASGYLTTYYNGVYNSNGATWVSVKSPQDTPNINFTLNTGGSISGHVYQADGTTPIEDAEISASLQGKGYSYSQSVYSDSDGSYLISSLQPGNYLVHVSADDYFPEYYDNVYTDGEATLVPVTLSNTTSNIDFTLGTGGSISGHVYEMDGITPIAGAEVYAEGDDAFESAYTGDDGSYTIRLLDTGSFLVYVEAEGYLTAYYDGGCDESEATLVNVTFPQDTPDIDFTLSTGGSISGHVYQADGTTPLFGAEVWAEGHYSSKYAYTHSDGSYTISELYPDSYILSAAADGYLYVYYDGVFDEDEATPVRVTAPQDTPNIDFALSTGGSISGHVFQSDGTTPIADARVYAQGDYDSGYAYTGDDGSFTIRPLRSDSYQVRVTASGYITTYYGGVYSATYSPPITVIDPQDTPNIDFTLDTGGSIAGYVYQPDGLTPVSEASLKASVSGENYSYSQEADVRADGSYSISLLVPGNYRVEVRSSGFINEYYDGVYNSAEAALVPVILSHTTSNIDFTLDTGGSISGYVYQSDGQTPIRDASVSAYLQLADYYYYSKGKTDPTGRYNITSLPPGNYAVRVEPPDYLDYLTEYYAGAHDLESAALVPVLNHQNTPDINFTLETGGSISGHIYQADGVTPIPYAYVIVSPFDKSAARVYSAEDGSYTISNLKPGDYHLYVSSPGFISEYYSGAYRIDRASEVPVTLGNEASGIDFTLDKGGSISGHIYQADGSTLFSNEVDVHIFSTSGEKSDSTVSTDGSYTLEGLPTGMYRVSVQAEGYPGQYYNGVFTKNLTSLVSVIAPLEITGIDFSLKKGGSISGHVYQADGVTPVPGASLSVIPAEAPMAQPKEVKSASDGSYALRNLTPGAYRVLAVAPGYIPEYYGGAYNASEGVPVSVVVSADTAGIDICLDPGAVIFGHVYKPDGITPVAGAEVGIELAGKNFKYVTTSANGSYILDGITSGSYLVYAFAYSYLSEYYNGAYYSEQAVPLTLTAPAAVPNIDFILDKGGAISGHVYQADGITPVIGSAYALPAITGHRPLIRGPVPAGPTPLPGLYLKNNSFTIKDLPPGEYRVQAGAYGYLSEYYNGSLSSENATLVTVSPGLETPDIDFTLDTGGSISGHVYQADGSSPICGAAVSFVVTGETSGGNLLAPNDKYSAEATTDSDGGYALRGLASGSYRVRVQAQGYIIEYYQDVYLAEEAVPVNVTAPGDTSGIDFSLGRRGDANQDGEVDMGDVTKVEMIILGLAEDTHLADANGDGKINMGDVVRIELDILGL
jgi:hypothetical protein